LKAQNATLLNFFYQISLGESLKCTSSTPWCFPVLFPFFLKEFIVLKEFCNFNDFFVKNFLKKSYKIPFDVYNYEKMRLNLRHILLYVKNIKVLKCVF